MFQEKSCVPVSIWQRETGTVPLPGGKQRENKINAAGLLYIVLLYDVQVPKLQHGTVDLCSKAVGPSLKLLK